MDPLAEVIRHLSADVVVCPEADSREDFDLLARRLEMRQYWADPVDSHGLGVLTRWAIIEAISLKTPPNPGGQPSPLRRACARVRLAAPDGQDLTVFGIHLSAHVTLERENLRVEEVNFLLTLAKELRQDRRPHVLLGDFNAVRPGQVLDPPTMRATDQKRLAAQHGVVPTRAIERILEAGYVDAFHAVHGDSQPGLTLSTQTPSLRTDYVFVSPDLADGITSAGVHRERLARYASDHWPVWADVDMPRSSGVAHA